MIWIILCKDKEDALSKRMAVIDKHREYLSLNPIKTLISGPLTHTDGKTMKGSAPSICELPIFFPQRIKSLKSIM